MGKVYFITNRNPVPDGGNPTDFGPGFNPLGVDELRLGFATFVVDQGVPRRLALQVLAEAPGAPLPSERIFQELRAEMLNGNTETIVFVHGYNVSFGGALSAAADLQKKYRPSGKTPNVIVFSWPSDGSLVRPAHLADVIAYKADRNDARASGSAFCRAMLKAADFMAEIRRADACKGRIHLLAHSMGNYVVRNGLQDALRHIAGALPRIFDTVLLMAADEDNDAFEVEHKLLRLPEMSHAIAIYANRGDLALTFSDKAKNNPARLGLQGPRLPLNLTGNTSYVDVSDLIDGVVEHSYFLDSQRVIDDAVSVLSNLSPDLIPKRRYVPANNKFVLT